MSSESAVIESNSAFSDSALTPRYQTIAMPATHQVETSGVRWRGEIDSPVRDAGMIVVCVEAIAEVATASSTTQSQPPSTRSDSSANTASSSSAFSASQLVPAKQTTATATPR